MTNTQYNFRRISRRQALAGVGLAMAAAGPMGNTAEIAAPIRKANARDCVALVTGSNSGIGLGFVQVLLARGAKRIYATARRRDTLAALVALDPKRVAGLELDVTNDSQRRAAAAAAQDVTWLINNAGIPGSDKPELRRFVSASNFDDARLVMETNFWGQSALINLFAPIIIANGGGAIVQILSVGALYSVPAYCSYSAAKFAASAMITGVRAELDRYPVLAAGVFTGGVKTAMTPAGYTRGISPVQHANEVLDALAEGETSIFAGTGAKEAYARVRNDPQNFERQNIDRFNSQR